MVLGTLRSTMIGCERWIIFFEWYEPSEDRKVRFAKMKLVGRAKLHWDSVVNHLRKTRQPPITLWEEMKAKLNENYFPVSHQGNLLDQWHDLRQDNRSATEYVEQFEEYRIRNATKDKPITLSRFRKGLNYDLQRELVARQISTLDDAYTLVQDLELIPRPQGGRRVDNRMLPRNNFDGPQGRYLQGTQNRPYPNNRPLHIEENPQGRYQQGPQTRPNPNNRPLRPEDKGKGVVREIFRPNSRIQCFKCQGFGHMAAQCPNKTLLIEELDGEEEVEEVVYEPNIEDIVEIREDDSTQLACIRALPSFDNLNEGSLGTPVMSVVRCTLAQSKESDDWKRNTIFQTFVKCGTTNCKVIINSGSCINAVSSKLVSLIGLKLVAPISFLG